jgi:BirA family transcriptional regulator, biotin operon repressor / biotin---[acetyl-CoA-carboxylase] ligase
MNNTVHQFIHLLSDKKYHDGDTIGKALGITRAAVWKIANKLKNHGIDIQSVKGKGYLLNESFVLLCQQRILSAIKTDNLTLTILDKTTSTNTILKKATTRSNHPTVCLAEEQTHGYGRFGRSWHSPFGRNIYLSIDYPFNKELSELSGLSLVTALSTCKAIESNHTLPSPLTIKWPNDIVCQHQKCASNLIEIQAESHGHSRVIIGVGVNVNMRDAGGDDIDQPWSSLKKLSGQTIDRNPLCATLINQLLDDLKRFEKKGLVDFIDEWQTKDALANRALTLSANNGIHRGIGAGINQQGHLLLKQPDGTQQHFASGDATLLK